MALEIFSEEIKARLLDLVRPKAQRVHAALKSDTSRYWPIPVGPRSTTQMIPICW